MRKLRVVLVLLLLAAICGAFILPDAFASLFTGSGARSATDSVKLLPAKAYTRASLNSPVDMDKSSAYTKSWAEKIYADTGKDIDTAKKASKDNNKIAEFKVSMPVSNIIGQVPKISKPSTGTIKPDSSIIGKTRATEVNIKMPDKSKLMEKFQ
jgi:hypothetical protein